MTERIIAKLCELFQFGLLASFGGLANYLYVTVHREKPFSMWMMVANLVLAFYVGNLVGSFLAESSYRDGILMAAGFVTYPILALLEQRSKRVLGALADGALTRILGVEPKKEKSED